MYRNTLRHEVAHAVLYDLYPGLPGWAHEGAASFTETQSSRGRRRGRYAASKREGKLHDTLGFLRGEGAMGDEAESIRAYYAQALLTFEALRELKDGPREALNLIKRIARDGPARALADAHLEVATLEATADRIAADQSVGGDD